MWKESSKQRMKRTKKSTPEWEGSTTSGRMEKKRPRTGKETWRSKNTGGKSSCFFMHTCRKLTSKVMRGEQCEVRPQNTPLGKQAVVRK